MTNGNPENGMPSIAPAIAGLTDKARLRGTAVIPAAAGSSTCISGSGFLSLCYRLADGAKWGVIKTIRMIIKIICTKKSFQASETGLSFQA